jgi:hypothetical protein
VVRFTFARKSRKISKTSVPHFFQSISFASASFNVPAMNKNPIPLEMASGVTVAA